MSYKKISILSILTDILVILVPAAIVSDNYSVLFWIIVGLDVLIMIVASSYYLIKNKSMINLEQILNANKIGNGLIWALGAMIWGLNYDWPGTIIWATIAVSYFISGLSGRHLKIRR